MTEDLRISVSASGAAGSKGDKGEKGEKGEHGDPSPPLKGHKAPVQRGDWDSWRWRIVAAFVALCVANITGFLMLSEETATREQAGRASRAIALNTAAIGKLTVASCKRGNIVRAYLRVNPSNSPERAATAKRLFPIVDCSLANFAQPLSDAEQQAFIRKALADD